MAHPLRLALPLAVGAALSLGAAPAQGQDTHRAILRDKLTSDLDAAAAEFTGVAGWEIRDLTSGDVFSHNADLIFPQGSAIKIPVLIELFRRAESEPGLLATRLPIRRADMVGGSGIIQNLTDAGSEMSLEDLATLMIVYSDNTATNLLIDFLGMPAINQTTASIGAPSTVVQRKMIQSEASARGDENLSTPSEATEIMRRIARCELPMSEQSCFRVQEILEIPKTGDLVSPIPSGVPVAWKPGGIEGVATGWGIVVLEDRPYAISIMTNYGGGANGDGGDLIQLVSGLAYDYFARLSRSTEYGARVPLAVIRRVRGGNQ